MREVCRWVGRSAVRSVGRSVGWSVATTSVDHVGSSPCRPPVVLSTIIKTSVISPVCRRVAAARREGLTASRCIESISPVWHRIAAASRSLRSGIELLQRADLSCLASRCIESISSVWHRAAASRSLPFGIGLLQRASLSRLA